MVVRCLDKEKYTSLEIIILAFFLLNSFTTFILINTFKDVSSIETLISIVISFLIGLIFLKKYFNGFKENSILTNLNIVIRIIFIISSLVIAVYSSFNLSVFIKDIILPNTNQRIIELSFLILAFILANKGLKSISISSNLMFVIYMFIFCIAILFNLFNADVFNLLPIKFDIRNLRILDTLVYSLGPLYMLLIIPKKEIMNFNEFKKKMYKSYTFFYIFLLVKILFIIAVLGEKYFAFVSYPELEILKIINIFNFFQRLEEVLIIDIFVESLIVTSFAMCYAASLMKCKKLDLKKGNIISLIVIFLGVVNLEILPSNILFVTLVLFIIINNFLCFMKDKP